MAAAALIQKVPTMILAASRARAEGREQMVLCGHHGDDDVSAEWSNWRLHSDILHEFLVSFYISSSTWHR